ncbi:MAG: hypothetical protein ACPG31_04685 [Planctomycetota bacterium]
MSREEAWSEDQVQDTLSALRANYTDNELYAIWCRDQSLIPADHTGKVLMEEWQLHASHDGRHVIQDGFKVSRPLYGRALKAEKGVAKASYKRRTKAEMNADRSTPSSGGGSGISEQAMSLAVRFDQAKGMLDAVRPQFRELEMFRLRMEDFGPAILQELGRGDMEAQEILHRLGLKD